MGEGFLLAGFLVLAGAGFLEAALSVPESDCLTVVALHGFAVVFFLEKASMMESWLPESKRPS